MYWWPGRTLLDYQCIVLYDKTDTDYVERVLRALINKLSARGPDTRAENVHLNLPKQSLQEWGGHIWAALGSAITSGAPLTSEMNAYFCNTWLPQHGELANIPFSLQIKKRDLTLTLAHLLMWSAYWQYGFQEQCPMKAALDQHCPRWDAQLAAFWADGGTDPSFQYALEELSDLNTRQVKALVSPRLYYHLDQISSLTRTRALEIIEWSLLMDNEPPSDRLLDLVYRSGLRLKQPIPSTSKTWHRSPGMHLSTYLTFYHEHGNQNAPYWVRHFLSHEIKRGVSKPRITSIPSL